MDKTVPAGAAMLLDFIGDIEAPKGYGTIYGNNQGKLPKPLTSMTVGKVVDAQASWTKQFKSSAAGRYQFMRKTLQELEKALSLRGNQLFDADLQDRLGYHLLKRRGYDEFMADQIDRAEFGKRLAQEWASLPVLATVAVGKRKVVRGQSYYAGDGLNKALVAPERVEAVLDKVKAAKSEAEPAAKADTAPLGKSKRLWTWLTTGGTGVGVLSGVAGLDVWLQRGIGVLLIGLAVYAIATMPDVRKRLGLG
ncbi:muramidase (phage lysozyme) [Mesorhizobium soli]|uniref:hypothetical protein n=1 Tax=Pseudaminobacter soli (ex Li et al. 2025) TaxID=1295366 RepID=UPI002472F149|nr:hypothetical protein [Mesorhizobium soli]MDH6229591.1 muramidase (phage lysozyme) [Mesorhizobium soli]